MESQTSKSNIRGSLDLLILKALALEPRHGVGIAQRIRQITQEAIDVSYGSLFPALHRMEEKGWLASEWGASDNGRRSKYYRLTRTGRKQLEREERQWGQVVKVISAALRSG